DALARVEHHAQPHAHELLVVDDADADVGLGHAASPVVSSARTRHLPSGRGPASNVPRCSAVRSCMPTSPRPAPPEGAGSRVMSLSIVSVARPSACRSATETRRAPGACRRTLVSDSCTMPYAASADRKSTRLNSSHVKISYAVFCLKTKTTPNE